MDWLAALEHLREQGRSGVLVTVTTVRGHTPREAGAKMVVAADATWDSIGGGNLEATAVDRARAMLRDGDEAPETMLLALNEHVTNRHGQQCCGGEVTILLEPLRARPTVAVFGVGHVGHELARILSRLPLDLHLVDSRPAQLGDDVLADVRGGRAAVHVHPAPAPEAVLRTLPPGAHVFVMSHDHAEDFLLCDAALRRGDLEVGLIGSRAKWARFRQRLRAEGHAAAAVDRIVCPIGLPGVGGKDPAVVAVSVAARLVQDLQGAAPALGPVEAPAPRTAPSAHAGPTH
jgi:xanthine dehydrogenase accessory factor